MLLLMNLLIFFRKSYFRHIDFDFFVAAKLYFRTNLEFSFELQQLTKLEIEIGIFRSSDDIEIFF